MPRQELTATQEEKMVDLDVSGPAIDVELPQEGAVLTEVSQQNGATKEEEEPRLVIEEEPKEEPKDELQDYSKGVKTRINKLTAKLREAERREQAATSFAESVKKQGTQHWMVITSLSLPTGSPPKQPELKRS